MTARSARWFAPLLSITVLLCCVKALALPGFYVGKNASKRASHATFVVLMNKGEQSVVSIMADYDGPFEPTAMVLAVPSDVTLDHITTIRREYVDRVDQLSAPRFHEFWEFDPCDPDKVTQEWERDLRVSTSGDNFLGGPAAGMGATKKVPKEMLLNMKSEQKQGEYTFLFPEGEQTFLDFAKSRGWLFTPPMEQAVNEYQGKGWKFVLAEIDPNRIELIGGEKAQLSPIRFWTSQPYRTVPDRLGMLSSSGPSELFVFVIDSEKHFIPKNYEVSYPPTNVQVDFVVKERMGEFFAGMHDLWLAKHPKTWWLEYAWSSDGCGQPCPNEPLLINEVLTLGADVFEQVVPDDERNPKPPPMTDEEKSKLKMDQDEAKPADRFKIKKQFEEDRKELYRRKALLDRHHYIITRLHHRVSEATFPNDVELAPANGGLQGGILLPTGPKSELPLDVKPSDAERLQTRYLFYHPWKGMQNCEKPERYRWGKPPRTYRGLRKTWVVEDLARKSRTQIKPADVVRNPLPEFGLTGEPPKPVDAGADGGLDGGTTKSGCHCSTPGGSNSRHIASGWGLLALVGGLVLRSRRKRRDS